ncbi:hypothetical protein GCK72_007232 [Caenorhabditis remanei]|uniref:C-type lectin domain-containing protein n=1 Tax=Caenorhabditis remanei TaxID=31234 RepID=A0A6A5HLL2_CAERE|nr:hypothetical protein GCK72_007232 [Caenorhabditis remanei]KAF1767273.1 hypothetical protein GCK72_007232 [Caenorhabditis remanei]
MKAILNSLLIAILSVLAHPIQCHLKMDTGLWAACNQTGTSAGFKPRSSFDSTEGDKCTLAFNVAVRDEDDAKEFCALYAPWRLVKAEIDLKDRPRVLCHVEATLACKNGWIQMFGSCFRVPDEHKVAKFPEAQEMCKAFGGTIASLRHKYIVGVWRRYFRGVRQIWVDASETWHQYIQKTGTVDGDAFAIAFTGKHYDFSVHPNSLIKINPNIKLQVLCEYKPEMTAAEINYLGRRYSEIYYPSVKVPNGILVRSASSYTTSTNNLEICKKALRPYMVDVDEVGPFVAEDHILAEIHTTNLPFTLLTRSGARARVEAKFMQDKYCHGSPKDIAMRFGVDVPNSNAGSFVLTNVPGEIKCDNMKSAAIVHAKDAAKLMIMSDSRSLPIWCKLGKKIKFKVDVPPNYSLFERANGEFVAHRLFTEELSFDKASERCKADGGFLSGVNDLNEANKLGALAELAGLNNAQMWLGGKRREACWDVATDFNSDTNPCSRNRVIQWLDNVAQDFYTDWWRNGYDHRNPSSKPNQIQKCLTYVQGKPAWADDNLSAFLDDIECYYPRAFYCTKKVTVLKDEQS